MARDRFYLVEHLFASGKETKSIETVPPGPGRDCGDVRLTAGTTYLPNVFG